MRIKGVKNKTYQKFCIQPKALRVQLRLERRGSRSQFKEVATAKEEKGLGGILE